MEVLTELRRHYQVPTILLTGRDEETDRVIGLELGADDYVVKPFSLRELAARIRSVLRRTQSGALLQDVWASSAEWQDPATVTEHVRRLRKKIEADPDRPRWIATVRGVGYRFEP